MKRIGNQTLAGILSFCGFPHIKRHTHTCYALGMPGFHVARGSAPVGVRPALEPGHRFEPGRFPRTKIPEAPSTTSAPAESSVPLAELAPPEALDDGNKCVGGDAGDGWMDGWGTCFFFVT